MNDEQKRLKALEKMYKAIGEYVKIVGGNIIIAGHTGWMWKDEPISPKKKLHTWYFTVECLGTPPGERKQK